MSMRVVLVTCALLGMTLAGKAHSQSDSPGNAAAEAGRPVIWKPADRDTVHSMWVILQGAMPQDFIGKCRDVEVFVNEASRGNARIRGVNFIMDGLRLDCLDPGMWNRIKAVCSGPSLKAETEETRIMLVPGPLQIDADLTTDAISPGLDAASGARKREVVFRFNFSTPADWTLKLTKGAERTVVRGGSGQGAASCEFTWDGTDVSGSIVEDGEYMYEMVATATCPDAGLANYVGVITVDTSVPGRPDLLKPEERDVLSPNFSLRWRGVERAWFYEVQLAGSDDFDPHEVYSTGATELKFSGREDGPFCWRVRAVSRSGTPGPFSDSRHAEVRRVMKPAISMLGVTTRSDSLAPGRARSIRLSYVANDDIVITIRIVTAYGTVVRTLLDGVARQKGPHVEEWNARDDGNDLVPAGTYVANVEAEGTERVTPFRESRLVMVQY